jgi:hypothetical protein
MERFLNARAGLRPVETMNGHDQFSVLNYYFDDQIAH